MSRRPNVIWITLDSVRADHTTLAGYDRDTTPELERIARSGTAFSTCFAHGNYTLSSSGAILTGTYPQHNTVGITGERLPDELPTVAERFADAGYRTACLSRNSYLSEATGLDRGFDRFSWIAGHNIHRAAGLRTLLKFAPNLWTHSAGLTTDTGKHATPFVMNDVAKRWLGDLQGEDPFFFYLHYNEPHRPYYPPGMTRDQFADELAVDGETAAEIAMDSHTDITDYVAGSKSVDPDVLDVLVAMYDAEVSYTDYMVGQLYDHIRSLPLSDTIVVVTADHGELFGERGLFAHKIGLDDPLLHVPLVVDGIDDFAADADDIVQHMDVMETLLGLAGADRQGTHGVDLREASREYAFAGRGPADFEQYIERNPDFETDRYFGGRLTAVRTHDYKYLSEEGGSDALYAMAPDAHDGPVVYPDEETDVSAAFEDEYAELSAVVEEFRETEGLPVGEGGSAAFDDAMQRQLSDLGYLD
ncbi:sulfatase [Haloarcula pellucida]|uniref:Choline-sulfatase n=1 Tax=Haloarcula pellucida TaxID=1427151 RepID=A0A830GJA9_9EURY|nr:sulfatase [Halomicroarcula pellucida]MBX0347311.1 sulfatase [Halomicroarcula pellucida]GGN88044.1 choline-sulfatase [Halomicroarcula pellucida]